MITHRVDTLMFLAALLVVTCGGCGESSDDGGTCDPQEPTCGDGLFCEANVNGEFSCLAPVVIRGRVLDLADAVPIAEALVQAVDANGAAVGTSAATDSEGAYELEVPATFEGLPPLGQLVFTHTDERRNGALFLRFNAEMLQRGVIIYSVCYTNYAHTAADIDETLEAMRDALEVMRAEGLFD